MLMFNQAKISPRRGMPVDLTNSAKRNVTKSAETIQLFYFNGSTYTIDGGEAAGTAVVGRTAYAPILGTLGANVGSEGNSSFYFTSDALTTEVAIEETAFEAVDYKTPLKAINELTKNLENGEYVVDYRKGIIYGKKATTGASLTAASYRLEVLSFFEFVNGDWTSPSSSLSISPSSSPSSSPSPSLSHSSSVSSSPSISPSSSESSSPSSSLSPSSSESASPSTSESSSESSSVSPSSSASSSKSSSPSSSSSSSPSSSISPSSSPSSSPSPRP